jgi:hypothetical protein
LSKNDDDDSAGGGVSSCFVDVDGCFCNDPDEDGVSLRADEEVDFSEEEGFGFSVGFSAVGFSDDSGGGRGDDFGDDLGDDLGVDLGVVGFTFSVDKFNDGLGAGGGVTSIDGSLTSPFLEEGVGAGVGVVVVTPPSVFRSVFMYFSVIPARPVRFTGVTVGSALVV